MRYTVSIDFLVRKGGSMLEAINHRELKFIEILSITMNLFIKNFKEIILVVAMLFFPISILNAMIMDKLNSSTLIIMKLVEAGGLMQSFPANSQVFVTFFENHILQMMVLLILEPVGIIAIARIIKSYLYNEPIQVQQAIGEAMNCIGAIIITGIPYGILVFLASLCFIFPGIYLGIVWIFYIYAIGLRGVKGWNALAYSKEITRRKFWKTLLFAMVFSFISAGWDWAFSTVLLMAPENIATDILYYTLAYISGSFAFVGMTVLFMNREAFILERRYNATEYAADSPVDGDKN